MWKRRCCSAAALRRSEKPTAAVPILRRAAAASPRAWGVQFELGAALAALGETAAAIRALTQATTLNPQSSLAWHALGDQLALAGEHKAAEAAQARPLPGAATDAALQEGARALFAGDLARADAILKDRFGLHPTDPTAVRRCRTPPCAWARTTLRKGCSARFWTARRSSCRLGTPTPSSF